MSLCKHCVSGVRHEGTAEGKFEKIGGVDTYVATPTVDYPKDKVLLFLPDIFGAQLINAQLLADDFARNGFKTIVVDYFEGDACPADALESGNFDLGAWFGKHGPPFARPLLDKVIAALKESGVTSFATTGYCYGGRLGFDLAFEGISSVTVTAHPSLLQIPADLEKYKETKVPLLINSCTVDSQFPLEAQAKADEILGDGKFAPGYKREYWDGCTHGFAVRGNLDDPKVKAGKEGAFKASVEFLIKYF
ncbi:alpha/beta-hydrolase [Cristinia sonorae]|uniref:Alpha/beta-hydrolase n=1 Tax=Cristinia sonorae TaxID=1940300 RepID=A0A8K0UUW3_9AGAR|nr:alpha/beta-hydrolase [Cristinia sonorae]